MVNENENETIQKINGFTRGINLYQITSCFILLTKIIFFFYLMIAKFPTYLQVIISIMYIIPTLSTIVSGLVVTGIDPTDDIVIQEKKCRLEGKPFDSDRFDYQCEYCSTSVSNNSKHCRTCNRFHYILFSSLLKPQYRCVQRFDHHCKWVNNCIAAKNYKPFIIMTVSLALSAFCFVLIGLLFILDYFTEDIGIIQNLSNFKSDPTKDWQIIVVIVYVVIIAIFAVLDLKLLYFHFYLIKNKMTTYDYIMKLRANREKMLAKNLKAKRTTSKIMPVQTPESPADEEDDAKTFNLEQQSSNKILHSNTNMSKFIDFRKINSDFEKPQSPESFAIELGGLQNQTSDDYYSKQHTLIQSPSHHLLSKQHAGSEPGTPPRTPQRDIPLESPTSNLINHQKLDEISQNPRIIKANPREKLRKQKSDSGMTTANPTILSVNQDHLSPKSQTLTNISPHNETVHE